MDTPRAQLLTELQDILHQDRNLQYGEPADNLKRIANLWDVYRVSKPSPQIVEEDVAIMMALVKIARLCNDLTNKDSWLDLAGYAALGYECSVGGATDG
jgi:hypothetical protein